MKNKDSLDLHMFRVLSNVRDGKCTIEQGIIAINLLYNKKFKRILPDKMEVEFIQDYYDKGEEHNEALETIKKNWEEYK